MIHEAHEEPRRFSHITHHASRMTRAYWRDGLVLAFLALLTLLFFWPIVLAGYWLPRGGGDLVSFLWPQY